jgi:hypothetical protein
MCRSIKRLRVPERAFTEEELRAAALQFVRKVSGFHKPSKANEAAFQQAIDEIAGTTGRLLDQLPAARSHAAPSGAPTVATAAAQPAGV